MRPRFMMDSDSSAHDVEGCTGFWNIKNNLVIQKFETGKDCLMMNQFIQAAYDLGVEDGKMEAAKMLNSIIGKLTS